MHGYGNAQGQARVQSDDRLQFYAVLHVTRNVTVAEYRVPKGAEAVCKDPHERKTSKDDNWAKEEVVAPWRCSPAADRLSRQALRMSVACAPHVRAVQDCAVVVEFALKVLNVIISVRGDLVNTISSSALLVPKLAQMNQNGLLPHGMIKAPKRISKGFRVLWEINNLHSVNIAK